jgi:hypothetical protein
VNTARFSPTYPLTPAERSGLCPHAHCKCSVALQLFKYKLKPLLYYKSFIIFQDWNDQLADIAHGWALQCAWGHNPDRSAGVNGYVGENLAVFTSIYIFCCAHSTRFFNEI